MSTSAEGMTTRVVKGSLWTLAGQVAPLAVSLIATPFTIRMLGAEGYGVLILVGLIPTYLGFADLGMGLASTKFASEAYAAGDAEREARTVRTAAFIALCVSVPVATLIFILSGWLTTLFNVPEHFASEASLALKVASFTFVINLLNSIFNTPQLTRLRMDLNTLVTSGFRIAGIAATPIVIYLGGGILGAVSVLALAALLTLAGHIYMSGRLLPPLFNITIDRDTVRPLLKFGGAYAISTVAALFLGSSEKFVLTHSESVIDLAYYSVAFTIATMLTLFSASMTQSLIPAFSQLQSEADRERLSSIYSRCIRIVLIAFLPTLVLVAVVARPFLTLWAGADFGNESVAPLHILLIGLLFNAVAFFPVSAIVASGRTAVLAKLYWAELLLYIPFVFWLVGAYGANGAAVAWSVRIIVDSVVLFALANRISGVSVERVSAVGTLAFIVIAIPFALVQISDLHVWIMFVGSFAAFATYGMIVWTKLLENEEILWLRARINAVIYR